MCSHFPFFYGTWQNTANTGKAIHEDFGFSLPKLKENDFVIWIHVISVGDARAVIPLYDKIRSAYPDAQIVISSTTETGHAEAKRCLKGASAYFFLPLISLFDSKGNETNTSEPPHSCGERSLVPPHSPCQRARTLTCTCERQSV